MGVRASPPSCTVASGRWGRIGSTASCARTICSVCESKFLVTTNSNHDRPVYPNLARDLVLTGLNQLWVADITYIRLELEFVFLAVILDAYSRRAIGWALD